MLSFELKYFIYNIIASLFCYDRLILWWYPYSDVLSSFVYFLLLISIVTDLLNALPGNSSVNTVQHATIEEAVFSVDPTDAPIDWLDSDREICVYCRSMSVARLYK
jgi:hypothetical protein